MTLNEIHKVLRKGAKSALYAWKQDESGLEDLLHDLWVWYLERPGTQDKLEALKPHEAVKAVKRAALQMLSQKQLTSNEFHGRNLYSSENVKEALLGVSKNRYLVDVLPRALDALDTQNPARAEAVRSRYLDGEIPVSRSKEQVQLSKAIKSLTEHVNVIAITAGVDAAGNVREGPGSRSAIFPELRRAKNSGHPDPTGDTAVLLVTRPDLREEYLHEMPLQDFLEGKGGA